MKQATYLVMGAVTLLAAAQLAQAGAGWADNTDKAGVPFKQPTFYANSPSGVLAAHGPAGSIAPEGTTRDTGTALRKFVDNLPMVDGFVSNPLLLQANAIGLTGRHIPTAVKEDLTKTTVAGAHSVSFPDADYYEIAVVEYREQLHSDLPAVNTYTPPLSYTAAELAAGTAVPVTAGPVVTGGTTLRGYVQIATPNLPAGTKVTQLFYLNGTPVLDNKGQPVFIVGDKPHYLGPVIDSTSGVPVRLKFNNYLPVGHYDPITKTRGGDSFIPTDLTVPGSGLGPLGAVDPNAPQAFERYTQNRTNIHLHGGDTPWISDGEPHDWITPAGENTPYKVGETTQNVPDMPDPGPGSQTLYYPNNQSARMMWYHDHSYGSTRIDVYAGIVSAFMIHDATEAALKKAGGTILNNANGTFTFSGALAGMDEIPLIFEDKAFVPKDIAVQDSKWSTDAWGQYGDLWFPHVYESNQNPNSIDGTNPAGRWDYGPWFWPVFPAPLALPSGEYGNASATQESFADTPVINGVAYPNLTVEPKAYRFRLLNASLQRYLNVGFWVAEPLSLAVSANGSNYPQTTKVIVGADDNGNVPKATLQISPIAAPTVTMTSGGSAYSATPTVTFNGDATVPATGHAVVVNGVIQGIVVDTAGSGYTTVPTVQIVDSSGGSGAMTVVTLNAGGQIMAIKLDPAPAGVVYSYLKATPTVTLDTTTVGIGTGAAFVASANTEVPMVDAVMPAVNPAYGPDTYDGRPGGIPDPNQMGPNIIQIGTEGGFLAQPNVITPTPVSYTQLRRIVTVLNIQDHGLYVGPAERADFVVDFSQFAGKTLIWYNDCPAPNPGFDARVDYYTGDADQTGSGGTDVTLPGFGPNTRTIMRVNVAAKQFNNAAPAAAFDPLNTGGPLATDLPTAFAASQEIPVVPESWQNAAYGTSYTDNTAHIYAGSYQQPTFTYNVAGAAQVLANFRMDSAGAGYSKAPTVVLTGGLDPSNPAAVAATVHAVLDVAGKRIAGIAIDSPGVGYINAPIVALNGGDGLGASATAIMASADPVGNPDAGTHSVFVQPKGIQELFESSYGRMNATFSVELPFTSVLTQTTIPVGYIDPPTDQIGDGEVQFWKVTHNGVDTHVVHFHLFNVQVINRVAWDGTIVALDPAEYGWKETVKMNPLEDIYVAVKPKSPRQPFGVPQSIRALDPTQAIGASAGFSQVDPKTGLATTVTNQMFNFDWEYVWHCHILGHEENDFMRVIMFNFGTEQPAAVPGVSYNPGTQTVSWTDPTPTSDPATYSSKANEQGFLIQRSENGGRTWPALPATTPQSAAQATNNPAGFLRNVVAANATSWVDPIPAGVNTVYRVLGFNSAGYSPNFVYTTAGTGAPGAGAPVTLLNSTGTPNAPNRLAAAVQAYNPATGGFPVKLTWSASPAPKNGFQIVREGGFTAAGVAVPAVTFTVPNSAGPNYTYTDTTSAEISAYTYTVYADNGTANAPLLSPGSLVQVATQYGTPPVVTGVTSKLDPTGNVVTVSWKMPPAVTPDPVNVTATEHVTAFNVVRTSVDGAGVSTTTLFGVQQAINPLSGTITLPDTRYADTQPVTGTNTYTIYAVNGDQTSTAVAPNNGSSTTIVKNAVAAPGVQGVSAIVNGATQVTVNWAAPAGGAAVTGALIKRTTGGVSTTVTLAGAVTTYVDTGLTPSTSYTYSVQWLNNAVAGVAQTATAVTTAVGAPVPVSNLLITAVAGNNQRFTNTLTWTAGANDASFTISRCVATTANSNCTAVGTVFTALAQGVTASTYADTTAQNTTLYVYQVQAVNKDGSAVSAGTFQTVLDMGPPAAPGAASNLIAAGSITVRWGASATAATTNYLVQRSSNSGVTWTQVGTVPSTALNFVDTGVTLGTTYQYRVYALIVPTGFATVQSTTASTVTTAVYTVQAAPVVSASAPAITGSPLTVSFNFGETPTAAPGVTGFAILRNTGAGFLAYATAANNATSYTDLTPAPGVINQYQVVANNILGSSAASATVSADVTQIPPSVPTGVTATVATGGRAISVSWTASTVSTGAPALTGYQVYQGTTLLTTTAAGVTSYNWTGAVPGNTYSFTVVAISAAGSSPTSTAKVVADVVPNTPAALAAPAVVRVGTTATDTVTVVVPAGSTVANAPAITSYLVEYSTNTTFVPGAGNYQSLTLTAPGTTVLTVNRGTGTFPNPLSGNVRVTAINAVGSSNPSNRTSFLQR